MDLEIDVDGKVAEETSQATQPSGLATDGISPKPDYSFLDTISGAANAYEHARKAGFTPDDAGLVAYSASGQKELDEQAEYDEASLLGKVGLTALDVAGGVMSSAISVGQGLGTVIHDVASNPELAYQAPANIAMAALMNSTDWGKDAMLYAIDKVAKGYEYATGNEAPDYLHLYSKMSEDPELAEKYRLSGQEMSETLGEAAGVDLGYDKYKGFYDVAGDFVNVPMIYTAGTKAIARDSVFGKLAGKAGLSEKWTNRIFANSEAVKEQASELKKVVTALEANGVNPSSAMNVASEAKKAAKAVRGNAVKETVAGELAVYGSQYKHDELYPEERTWRQNLAFNVALPAALGVGLPMAAAANRTRQLFNVASYKADARRNSLLQEELTRNGISPFILESQKAQFGDALADFGLVGNQASDIAVVTNYELKNLKTLKENALNKLESINLKDRDSVITDAGRYYDELILAAEKKNNQALEDLISGVSGTDKEFVKTTLIKAQDNWSNVLQGTNKVTLAPRTQVEMEKIFGESAAKLAKLEKQAKSTNPRLKPENRIKRLEALEKAKAEGYQIIDANGNVYESSNFHMPWADDPKHIESIQSYQKPVMTNGEKATSFKVKVQDDSIVKDDLFDLSSGVDGSVMIKRGASGERALSYTDTAAWNPAWQLVGKQLKWALKGEKDKAGRLVTNFEKLGNKLTNKIPVNLNSVNHVQASYLEQLARNVGDSQMTKVFAFNDKVLGSLKKQLTSSDLPKPELADVFHELRTRTTQDFLHMREYEKADKASIWQFPKFTDESLFTEMTGLKLNKQVLKDTGSLEIAARYSDDAGLFTYKPQRYAIQETNSLGALTDEINNEIFNRLAATREFRQSTLTKSTDTLVGDIARSVAEKPQFKNGYLSSPNSLAYDTDVGGRLGRYLMTQEARTEGNITANAAVAFSNEMALQSDKLIGQYMSPLVERVQKFISRQDAVDDFGKFRHQTQSGWYMADAEPVQLENGRFAFKLDDSKRAQNLKVADRQSKLSGGRFTFDEKDLEWYDKATKETYTLLPDPVTGQPLTVDAEVADLLYETHKLNSKIWQGNQDINRSIGRQGTQFRNYWMPSVDLSNGEVRIVGHQDGNIFVPDLYVRGNTVKQAEEGAKLEMSIAGWDKKREYSIRTPSEIHLEKEIIREDIDATGFRFANYGDPWAQQMSSMAGSGVRTSKGNIIETGQGAVREWLEGMNHTLQVQARRTRMAMFTDEINSAQALLSSKQYGDKGFKELNDYIANLSGSKWSPQDARSKVYRAFDKLVEQGAQAFDDWRNLDKYTRMEEAKRIADGRLRMSSSLFDSGDEVKRLYNFRGEIFDQAREAMVKLGVTKVPHSKEIIGQMNKLATWGLLMTANFGYSAMNLVSLPAVMPMMLKSMRKLPGETEWSMQARLGAWAKVDKHGNVYPDLVGGAMETLNYYGHNTKEFKQLMADAEASGVLSTKATLLGEAFIDPVGSVLSKGGRKIADYVSKLPKKSEEISRVIPYAVGYRMGRRAGFGHAESMSMARKFSDKIVGSYVSSNRPALLTDGLGSLLGLFYTYSHNLTQNYVNMFLTGQKAAAATGLATQAFMFGPTSVPGFDQFADLFIPLDSGRDLYSALRSGGFNDEQARAWIYGVPSAITGLDFSSKGQLSPNVPGTSIPPVLSLGKNIWDMTSESINALAATTNTNARTLLEIMQNYLPFTAAKSSLALGMGYKTDRAGRIVADKESVGELEWYAANILSMRTLDETMNRRAMQRNNNYIAHQNEIKGQIRRNMASGLRSGRDPWEVIHENVVDYLGAGGDPAQIKNFIKNAVAKAYTPTIAQQAKTSNNKRYQTPSDMEMAKTLRYLAIAGSDNEIGTSENW